MKKYLNKSTLLLLLLVAIATGMMGISSFDVRNKGNSDLDEYYNNRSISENTQFDNNIVENIFSQTMVGYYELKKAQDPELEAYDIFISTDEDKKKEQEELRKSLDSYYGSTLFNPNYAGAYVQYLIQDNVTKKTISNDTTQTLASIKDNPNMTPPFPWYIVFTFDSIGSIHVSSFSFLSEQYTQGYVGSNRELEEIYLRALKESGGYSIRSGLGETSTTLVKDATFVFALDQKTVDTQMRGASSHQYGYDAYTGYAIPINNVIVLILGLLIFSLGIKAQDLPQYQLIRKVPYEVHTLIICFIMGSVYQSYGLFCELVTGLLSVGTLWSLIQLGILYLYLGYVCTLLKDNYDQKSWKPYFIAHKASNYLSGMDLSKKDSMRILLMIGANLVGVFILMGIGTAEMEVGIFFALLYSGTIYFIAMRFLNKTRKDYQTLLRVTKDLSSGDFKGDLDKNLGIFNDFKNDIVEIRANFKHAVEEEVHSQKMKTELISNVSHDLKTPLTSIITYTDLLKKEDLSEKERKKYINTLDRNALRLKHLIEDLFEVSKANSGNIKLEKMEIDICSLMKQVQVELADKFKKAKLDIRNDFASEKILCVMDPQKTYRIFENLLINITKYALPSTRVYINIVEDENDIEISLRNISANELDFKATDLTERFMRGDKSRNTEGSGLGLAIAKTFSELHDGKLDICIDGDLFKVILHFPKYAKPTQDFQPQE